MFRLRLTLAALIACLTSLSTCYVADAAQAGRRPNVILIMADDLGYETIGANGGTSYKTPNLDRLAGEGMRFSHCYVQPLCTPTRVQLMTGKYNVRNYANFGEMDPQAVTFGNLFKQAGYATCIAGKWQLGRDPELPKKYGFEEHCLWQHLRRPPRYVNPGLEINGVEKDFTNGEYGPDLVNEYVIDYVKRQKERPFFVYYPMMLTHGPYMATPDSADWDPKLMGERQSRNEKHFGDMVVYMDKLIGKLDTALSEAGVRENTLLIFLGDNGTGAGTRSMMGDRVVIGGKGSTTEAGMHVPLIVSWPGHISRGQVSDNLVDSTDFLPTICDAAGIRLTSDSRVDGRSFLPQLTGASGQPRKWIYSWYSPRGERLLEFAFNQHYKLYRGGEFFELARDPEEKSALKVASLSGEAASAAKELQAALDQYRDARPPNLPMAAASEPGAKKAKKKNKAR
jgi:arylsulfatase A